MMSTGEREQSDTQLLSAMGGASLFMDSDNSDFVNLCQLLLLSKHPKRDNLM